MKDKIIGWLLAILIVAGAAYLYIYSPTVQTGVNDFAEETGENISDYFQGLIKKSYYKSNSVKPVQDTPTPTPTSTPTPYASPEENIATATPTPYGTLTVTATPTLIPDSGQTAVTAGYTDKWGYNYFKRVEAEYNSTALTDFYELLYEAVSNYETEVDPGKIKITGEDAWRVYFALRLDNPELIQADSAYSYDYDTKTNYLITFKPELKSQSEYDISGILEECEASVEYVRQIIENKYGSNPEKVQIVKEIHDYIIQKKEYGESDFDQSMAGALSDDYTPRCASYSLAVKYMCNCFGIQCEVVTGQITKEGQEGAHMWNIINYGDNVDYSDPYADYHPSTWYELDATWDDPTGSVWDFVRYDYFNLTTSEMNTSRYRDYTYYAAYPVDNCLGTDLRYTRCLLKGMFR